MFCLCAAAIPSLVSTFDRGQLARWCTVGISDTHVVAGHWTRPAPAWRSCWCCCTSAAGAGVGEICSEEWWVSVEECAPVGGCTLFINTTEKSVALAQTLGNKVCWLKMLGRGGCAAEMGLNMSARSTQAWVASGMCGCLGQPPHRSCRPALIGKRQHGVKKFRDPSRARSKALILSIDSRF